MGNELLNTDTVALLDETSKIVGTGSTIVTVNAATTKYNAGTAYDFSCK